MGREHTSQTLRSISFTFGSLIFNEHFHSPVSFCSGLRGEVEGPMVSHIRSQGSTSGLALPKKETSYVIWPPPVPKQVTGKKSDVSLPW